MPRPVRARHAPTRSARATNAIATSKPSPAPATEREALSDVATVDDDGASIGNGGNEAVVARRASLRASRNRTASTATESIGQKMVMDRAKQRRDAAMERLGNITSTTGGSEEDQEEEEDEEIVKNTQQQEGSVHPEERVKATPMRPRHTDVSGLDLDDSMFDDLNTTMDTVAHTGAQRSAETSTLSNSHFRRRPRAGSFLSRDDGPIRPSSRAGNHTPAFSSTLNFGVFKRRAREPSILSTAQKPRALRPNLEHEQEDHDNDDENDDKEDAEEGEFAPEDESTPLRRSTRGSGRAGAEGGSISAQSRKRKSTETHEQRLRSSPFEADQNIRQSVEQPQVSEDDESLLSSPPSLHSNRLSTPARVSMDPELMAPPMSSDSSENNEELWPPLKSIPKARARQGAATLRRTPGLDDGVSDMSSPPSLTHSPNYAASSSPPPTRAAVTKSKRKQNLAKPPPKLTTAELTGMLPRRRRRVSNDDPFGPDVDDPEVDASGLREGEDELEHLDTRSRRRPTSRTTAATKSKSHSAAKTSSSSSKQNDKNSTDKSLEQQRDQQGSKKRVSRTYGRLSDKENENGEGRDERDDNADNPADDDVIEEEEDEEVEDSQMLVERIGEELKNAVRKFQEVDKWELSFEEKDRSSSPLNAR
ncbi:hypothetical protein F5Y17DRAFT_462215 [Xylariaceae sp. FL0594]|nr:hypothetical protein F5Y17DRAFT_462215 [Xylariaceae sp. FL0594]